MKIKSENKAYVLDTSALLALKANEEGADRVEEILRMAEKKEVDLFVSFMSYVEVYYRICQLEGEESARLAYSYMKMMPLKRVDVNEEIILISASIKANYKLSVADAFIIATAAHLGAKLLHKDPEFEQVKGMVILEPLPYK